MTALRIGAKRDHLPTKVYLYAGTKKGCKALGLECKDEALSIEVFPPVVQALKPYEIEDFVCIYKKKLSECFADTSRPES
jgi:hypothetical protein